MLGVQTCALPDRKSTRLNSSHTIISYAVFCLKKDPTPEFVPAPPGRALPAPPRPPPRGGPRRAPEGGARRRARPVGVHEVWVVFFFLKRRAPPAFPPFPPPPPSVS